MDVSLQRHQSPLLSSPRDAGSVWNVGTKNANENTIRASSAAALSECDYCRNRSLAAWPGHLGRPGGGMKH